MVFENGYMQRGRGGRGSGAKRLFVGQISVVSSQDPCCQLRYRFPSDNQQTVSLCNCESATVWHIALGEAGRKARSS